MVLTEGVDDEETVAPPLCCFGVSLTIPQLRFFFGVMNPMVLFAAVRIVDVVFVAILANLLWCLVDE